MIYKLKPEHTRYLLNLPETGIGYQEVEARPVNSDVFRKFIVFNAELAIEMNNKFKTKEPCFRSFSIRCWLLVDRIL